MAVGRDGEGGVHAGEALLGDEKRVGLAGGEVVEGQDGGASALYVVEASFVDELMQTLRNGFTAEELVSAKSAIRDERVVARASDAGGVTEVRFFVDGVLLGTDTTSPYSID